jgi:hypothetical protein
LQKSDEETNAMWYAAHVIMYFKVKEGVQDQFLVWENIWLVEAKSSEEAWEKAVQLGRAEEGDDEGSLRWNDRPATCVFAGVRKVVECQSLSPEYELGDRTEITYSQLVVDSEEALAKLVNGDPVSVLYEE